MFLLQNIFKLALILCIIIGSTFMIASTVFVFFCIVHGNISIHVNRDETEKEKQ